MTTEAGAAGSAPDKIVPPPGANGADTKGAAGAGSHGADDETVDADESKWDDKTKAIVTKLRKENASRRTANKTLEEKMTAMQEQFTGIKKSLGIDTEEPPEKRIETLQASAHAAQHEATLYKIALQKGIPGDDVEYFGYLVNKGAEQLADGEEMSEEALDAIVADVKKRSAKAPATTSVGAGTGGGVPPTNAPNEITVEQFAKMTITQKSDLYTKNKDLYDALFQSAKEKRILT